VLETTLRLAHPIIPFITEALWQTVAPIAGLKGESVSIAAYPESQPEKIDAHAEAEIATFKTWVDACRNLRGEMGLSPAARVPMYVVGEVDFVTTYGPALKALVRLSDIKVFESETEWAAAADGAPAVVLGQARAALFVAVDLEAETKRLSKEIAKLDTEIAKANGKLSNDAFVAKAPPAVIEQERARIATFSDKVEKMRAQLEKLQQRR
jgi:valyl-tRNA synthetase